MSECGQFERHLDALPALVDFTARAFASLGIPGECRFAVDLVLEELFTNVAKYGNGTGPVQVEFAALPGGVAVTLSDFDAEFFDITQAPTVDIRRPASEREPGGLGLHLIRSLVDSIDYRYSRADRCSRITFRKAWPAAGEERRDAVD